MAIAIVVPGRDVSILKKNIEEKLQGEVPVWIYPDIPDPGAVRMAVVWKHPPGSLQEFPNLAVVHSLGAGVEHLLDDVLLPAQAKICRIVDPELAKGMCQYAAMAILNIHKQWWLLQEQQARQVWEEPVPEVIPLTIGVLGLGELGLPVAKTLSGLGFEVLGYSRKPKTIAGIPVFSEEDMDLPAFAKNVNALVCVLPLTPQTAGVLNLEVFRSMPKGSYLVNIARGAHVVDADLLQALEEGIIERAVLDVFHTEPLPVEHPFWYHPKVTLTPHIASVTNQENAAAIIVQNYQNLLSELPLQFPVDPGVGY